MMGLGKVARYGIEYNYGKNDAGELPSMHQPGREWGDHRPRVGGPAQQLC